jgi:hypothetical protein
MSAVEEHDKQYLINKGKLLSKDTCYQNYYPAKTNLISELLKTIEYFSIFNKFYKVNRGFLYNTRVLASEYIMNTLLYKNKKFHLRMYYMISIINGTINSFVLDYGKILTAAKVFNTKMPFTKDVHDTHIKSTKADIFFPDEFTDSNLSVKGIDMMDILSQIRLILSNVSILIVNQNTKILYDNHKNGYNLFGVDLID